MLVIMSKQNKDYFVGFCPVNKIGNRIDYELVFSKRIEDAQPFDSIEDANHALPFIQNANDTDDEYTYKEVNVNA